MNIHINKHYIYQTFIFILFIALGFRSIGQDLLLPDTLRTCHVDSLYLEGEGDFNSYLWSTGDTTIGIWIKISGDYILTAVNDTATFVDSTYIIILGGRIFQDDTLLLCGDTILLSGNSELYDYYWTPGDTLTDSLTVYPRTKTLYFAEISDPGISIQYCLDSVEVDIENIVKVDTVMQLSMGCPEEEKAQIKVEVSGGFPPYTYDWPIGALPSPGDSSLALGLTDGTKNIFITDTIGCFVDHEFFVEAHPIPELVLYSDPVDTVYLQNPFVSFEYENPQYDSLGVDTFYVSWWEWSFGDSAKSTVFDPTHAYQQAGDMTVILNYKTFYNCKGADSITIEVKPVKFFTPAVITPNGDGLNDLFEVWYDDGSGSSQDPGYKAGNRVPLEPNKYYKSNTLILFNRWGEKVYETDNYQNDWSPEGLFDGTYFYLFKCVGEYRTDVYKGTFLILSDGSN